MEIKLNIGGGLEIEECDANDLIEAAYLELISVSAKERREHTSRTDEQRLLHLKNKSLLLVDANNWGLLRLPKNSFGRVRNNLPSITVDVVVSSSPLAISLLSLLSGLGVPSKILGQLRPGTKRRYEDEFNRVIAGIAMSITGARDWGDLDGKIVLQLLQSYACSNSRSFRRKDLWGSRFNVAGRFLREIARALGQVHNSIEIGAFYRAERSGSPNPYQSPPAHLSAWMDLYLEWRNSVKAISRAPNDAMGRLLSWLDQKFAVSETENPRTFLTTKRTEKLVDFIAQNRKKNKQEAFSSSILVELGAISRFSEFIREQTGLADSGEPVFPLVSRNDIEAYAVAVNESGRVNNSGEVSSLPLPPILHALFYSLLLEGKEGWPGTHRLCQFFSGGEKTYCPVLPSLFLLSFELPGRFIQLVNLDSGEGDERRFDGRQLAWGTNHSAHAGYWKRLRHKNARGYARKTRNQNITGFFFNINKTGTPFVVPWQNEAAHGICHEVREFVERYVPISVPVAPKDYRTDLHRSDQKYFDKLIAIFPLFRMPAIRSQKYGHPVNWRVRREFWLDAMLEVQNRYNESVPPEAALHFVTVDANGKPIRCEYMPHGMRSAGISRLLRDGVSINIVSKLLVGHASIPMTQRYNKPEPEDMHNVLEGNRLARTPTRGNLTESLKRMSFEEATRRTVCGSEEVLSVAFHKARSTWVERDVGLCPWMGQRCKDGGECLRRSVVKGVDRSLYKSIKDGNCLVCRHLITDPTYLEGIYAKIEVLSRKLAVLTRRYNETSSLLFELEMRSSEEVSIDEAVDLDRRRKRCQVDLNDIVQEQDSIAETIAYGQRYIEQLRLIERFKDTSEISGRRLVHPENALSEWNTSTVQDEWVLLSDFEHLTRIMHNSTFFTSAYDAEAEASFKLLMDNLFVEAGHRPISLNRRTNEEQKDDYLRASRLILNRINRLELIAMEEGTITPDDLGFKEFLKDLRLERIPAPINMSLPISGFSSISIPGA